MAINGDPGATWTNDTGKIYFQFHVNWSNTCGVCAQYDGQIGNSFPIPYHYNCRCFQSPVFPGKESQPFTDFLAKAQTLDPGQQAALVGKSNWTLIEKGVVKFADVVTEGRVRDLREVVSRNKLTVKEMVKAGVAPKTAADAYATVNTAAHALADEARKRIAQALKDKGLSNAQIKQAVAERLAGRVSIGRGPSGPQALPVKPTPLPPGLLGGMLGVKLKPVPPPTPKPGVVTKEEYDAILKTLDSLPPGAERDAKLAEWVKGRARPPANVNAGGMSAPEKLASLTIDGVLYQFPEVTGSNSPFVETLLNLSSAPPIPAPLMKATSGVVFTAQSNKYDSYWAAKFNDPGFRSVATGGSGTTVVYNGDPLTVDVFAHEAGHNFATTKYGTPTPGPASDFAKAAATGEPPVSSYASHNLAEDFAEAVSLYVEDPVRMKSIAPERFKVIQKLMMVPGYGG